MNIQQQFEFELAEYEKATDLELNSYRRSLESNGFSILIGENEATAAKVYSPEFALKLTTNYPDYNFTTQKVTYVKGWEFYNSYIEAFQEGKLFLDMNYPGYAGILYTPSAEKLINNLKENYFNTLIDHSYKGWVFVKTAWTNVNEATVKLFGYHSGIVSSVDELIKMHPECFVGFYDRTDQEPLNLIPTKRHLPTQAPQPEIHPKSELTLSDISKMENKFCRGLPMEFVISHLEALTFREKNSVPFLTESQFVSFLKKGFLNYESEPKQKFSNTNGKKSHILKHFHTLYTISKERYYSPKKMIDFRELVSDCFDNWTLDETRELFKPGKTTNTLPK